MLRVQIREPDTGSGIGKKSGSGSGMKILNHICESLETILVKILKFLDADADPVIFLTLDKGPGMKKIRVRDVYPPILTKTSTKYTQKKDQLNG